MLQMLRNTSPASEMSSAEGAWFGYRSEKPARDHSRSRENLQHWFVNCLRTR